MTNEEYLNSLNAQNEELEMEIQIQCEEKAQMQERIVVLERKLETSRRSYVLCRKAGDKLNAFIEELISNEVLIDEAFDEANDISDNWKENR